MTLNSTKSMTLREATGLPPIQITDYSVQPVSGFYIIIWILAVGITIALGFFFWWCMHSKFDRENQVTPIGNENGGVYTGAGTTERNGSQDDSMCDVPIYFSFDRIVFIPIEGSNYFHQVDLLQKVAQEIINIYGELFQLDDDTRIKSDKIQTYVHMRKLQIFEQQACSFQQIIDHYSQILLKEEPLYAKLIDPPITETFKRCIFMTKKLIVEKQVLEQDRLKSSIENKLQHEDVKSLALQNRQQMQLTDEEQLRLQFLLIIKGFIEQTFVAYRQLKTHNPDSKVLESVIFTISNYGKHMLQQNIKSYKEDRSSLQETLSVLRQKFALWPTSVEFRPYLSLSQLDRNTVLELTQIATVQWLDGDDEVINSDNSQELRQTLLRINREFQKLEVAERKFKIALTQTGNKFFTQNDDSSAIMLKEQALAAFITYCEHMYKEIKYHPGKLDGTGMPDDFAWSLKKADDKPNWAQGTTDTKSRLQLLMKERNPQSKMELAPQMIEFDKSDDQFVKPYQHVHEPNKKQYSQIEEETYQQFSSIEDIPNQKFSFVEDKQQMHIVEEGIPQGTDFDFGKLAVSMPNYAPIQPPEPSHSGDKFSLLARQYGMVTLQGNDVPHSMRYDALNQGPRGNRFDPRMPASLQPAVEMERRLLQNNPPVRPLLLSQVMDEPAQFEIDFQDGQQYGDNSF